MIAAYVTADVKEKSVRRTSRSQASGTEQSQTQDELLKKLHVGRWGTVGKEMGCPWLKQIGLSLVGLARARRLKLATRPGRHLHQFRCPATSGAGIAGMPQMLTSGRCGRHPVATSSSILAGRMGHDSREGQAVDCPFIPNAQWRSQQP